MLTTRRITLNWLRNQPSCGTLMKLVRLPLYHVREKPESQRVDLNLNFKDNIFFLATKQVEALEEVLVTEDIKAMIVNAIKAKNVTGTFFISAGGTCFCRSEEHTSDLQSLMR